MRTILGNILSSLFSSKSASKNTLSDFSVQAPHEYGQPRPEQYDVEGTRIDPKRMREIALKTPTVAACINSIVDYAQGVKIKLRNVDPTQIADPDKVKHVQDYMSKPNNVDTWRWFLIKIIEDMAVMGAAVVEIEPDSVGYPANLNVIDAARVKIDFDETGVLLGYNILDAYGRPKPGRDGVHTWQPNEIIYFSRNPVSNTRYARSQLQQLYSCAILEDLMLSFIGGKFTESNIPYGIYDLGDVSEEELDEAVSLWNEQSQDAQHKVILTGSKSGGKWNIFGYHLKDLDCAALLQEVRGRIMGVLGVTMNELGDSQDVNKSNGYNLSFTFKKRAVEPGLDELTSTLTKRFLWDSLHYNDLEYFYEEIDSRDELLAAQIDDLYLKMGVVSPNEIRNRRGDPSVPGGDELGLILGNSFIPLNMLTPMAKANLQALIAAAQPQQQGGSGEIKQPRIQGPQPPQGENNEKVKVHYRPKSTPPRGPVAQQAAMGLRKD